MDDRIWYEFLRKVNPIFPPYEVFDKFKDDIDGFADYITNEHPDMKEEIEKIVKQLKEK